MGSSTSQRSPLRRCQAYPVREPMRVLSTSFPSCFPSIPLLLLVQDPRLRLPHPLDPMLAYSRTRSPSPLRLYRHCRHVAFRGKGTEEDGGDGLRLWRCGGERNGGGDGGQSSWERRKGSGGVRSTMGDAITFFASLPAVSCSFPGLVLASDPAFVTLRQKVAFIAYRCSDVSSTAQQRAASWTPSLPACHPYFLVPPRFYRSLRQKLVRPDGCSMYCPFLHPCLHPYVRVAPFTYPLIRSTRTLSGGGGDHTYRHGQRSRRSVGGRPGKRKARVLLRRRRQDRRQHGVRHVLRRRRRHYRASRQRYRRFCWRRRRSDGIL